MINSWEVQETNEMIEKENLDVRTITLGISLLDCIDSDLDRLNQNIYNKITTVAKDLVATGEKIEKSYSIPLVNKRISVTPIALVVSARVSYTQFWKESGNFEKYCKERMKNARKLARSRRHKDYFNECWDYVEFCGERLNLSVSYEKQKDYIKNLYKNEDYMTLERVFRPYFKMMQKSLQKNELFAEDEEIFDIYIDVLEKTGKTVQRSKIGTLI